MKKIYFTAVSVIISINAFGQNILTEGGNLDTIPVTWQGLIAPLYSPYPQSKTDSAYIGLMYNTVDFKIVSGGLALAKNNVSTSEWYGRIVAVGNQKNFIFANIPINYWDYQMFKNGVKIIPEVDYFKTGNSIYIPSAKNNYIIEYYRLR